MDNEPFINPETIKQVKKKIRKTPKAKLITLSILGIVVMGLTAYGIIASAMLVHTRREVIALQGTDSSIQSQNNDLNSQVSDLSQKLDNSTTQYNDLKQAVIIEASNQESPELTSLYNACGPVSYPFKAPVIGAPLSPSEQKQYNCINAAQNSYIESFINNNQ